MKDTFAFLLATRFWAMAIAVLSVYAEQKGWIGPAERTMIAALASGFVVVRTIDRAAEQKNIAAAVSSGQLSNATVAAIPGLATTEPVQRNLEEPDEKGIDPDLAQLINRAVAQAVELKLAAQRAWKP